MTYDTDEAKIIFYDLLRPEIRKIARQMETKFQVHSDRGDPFKCEDMDFLFERQEDEFRELTNAMGIGPDNFERRPPSVVLSEAADVCNFILMIAVAYEKEWMKGKQT